MKRINEPYIIQYPLIVAVADEEGSRVELIEFYDCIGGAMWSLHHYVKSPLVAYSRIVGHTIRYMTRPGQSELRLEGSRFPAGIAGVSLDNTEISITYLGMGGGGVGAAACRDKAQGILRARSDDSGGGKIAGSTIWLPRRRRILIGVDDTDTPDKGATWTLVHNIARTVEDNQSVYLSHTIVQLFPVPYRTKNCVSIVAEFASSDPVSLVDRFHRYLQKYNLSDKTGMAVYSGFSISEELLAFGRAVKRGEVGSEQVHHLQDEKLRIIMDGRGITGAVAAIPFFTDYEEGLELCSG